MVGARLGPVRLVALRNPELVERVLVDDADAYTKGLALKRARVVLGDGLLTSEGDVHRREALLIGPALARRRMPEHEATMVAVARRTGERWREGREIDLLAEMAGLTLRIVTTALFGRELTTAEIDAVAHGLAEVLDGLDWLMTNPLGPLRERIRTRRVRRLLAGRHEIYGVVARLVADRRAAGAGDDLLGVLVDATAAGAMDERLLRDEVVGLLLAGHETTAVWLSSTWLALAEHPDVDARVHAELRDALGDRTVRLTDAERLPYLRAVMEETLRLAPPVWGLGRRATRERRLGPYRLPRGTIVSIQPHAQHRDPRCWPDAELFRPERWLEMAEPPARGAFLPFAHGPRRCLGEHFARAEALLAIATLVREWRLERVTPGPLRLRATITLRPAEPVAMTPRRRAQPCDVAPRAPTPPASRP